jgi:hypothetical protein
MVAELRCNTRERMCEIDEETQRSHAKAGCKFCSGIGNFPQRSRFVSGREIPHMRRLALWLRHFFGKPIRPSRDDDLPFTAEDFARLISSGKSEDMKTLAEGLSCAAISRNLKALAAADPVSQQQLFISAAARRPKLRPPTSSAS